MIRRPPASSSVEEGEVNLLSAKGILRQSLFGNLYFRNDFGKAINEYMLLECFRFPASLPTILAHAGLNRYWTQKLTLAGTRLLRSAALDHQSRPLKEFHSTSVCESVPMATARWRHSIPAARPAMFIST
jgi:alpha-mannosidase